MSESSISTSTAPAQRRRLHIITLAVIIPLGLLYLSGYFVLPNTIRSAFDENNCERVLARSDTYARFYPSTDNDLAGPIRECAVYTLALSHERENAWRDSYNAFTVYSETYPEGRFADDAHKHLATVLMGLAREEMTQKNHARALELIDRVLRDHNDADLVKDAESLKLDLYMSWGADLRESGHFAEAERMFDQVNQSTDARYAKPSQLELAQTYLAWGLDLQSQQHFAEAILKFDTAAAADPDSQSSSGLAGQAKASQVELYKQWGDYLLEQGDYASAMGQYATAASLSGEGDDIVANGYIRWAEVLSDRQDFIGAMVLLDFAQANAATDAGKKLVTDTRSDVYSAFSRSEGEQTQQVMLDAAAIICRHRVKPGLPIFGSDSDNAHVAVYGLDEELPQSLAATTPGSLHYVACVEQETRVVQSVVHKIISAVFGIGPPYEYFPIAYERLQYVWTVTLRDIETGDDTASMVIEGGTPPPLPETLFEIQSRAQDPQFWGPKPDFADLVDWLLSVTKK